MKRFLALGLAVAVLAGCQTSGINPTGPSDAVARICPPLAAALTVLENSPSLDVALRQRLTDVQPMVRVVCDGDSTVTTDDLHRLEDLAIPVIIDVIADSAMDDKQKNIAILSVAVAQAVLISLR